MIMRTLPIVILLMIASSVGAGELPSEIDLRASYCIPIVQHFISYARSNIPDEEDPKIRATKQEVLTETQADLRRLQLYLFPRIPHLDKAGVAAAMTRADEDWVKSGKHGKACSAKCAHLLGKDSWLSCHKPCTDNNPFHPRMKSCFDLSWLPF
jgi:hypothetical protein